MLPDDAFFASNPKGSYQNTVLEGDPGHGVWDDEEATIAPPEYAEANRWTNRPMLQFLRRCLQQYVLLSASGNVATFLGSISNIFMRRWPPVCENIFIDPQGKARSIPSELIDTENSPKDAPFPRIDKGYLDLGPNLCVDGCALVMLMPELRIRLGNVLEYICYQVKQWFQNNKKG
ncbi:uncharacterized protein ARMOST_04300 [Armillaria ostoyae]|uniref:Uncharacterized protein n=1 Tax=Armillaria ostoyae TaxID=47428 RepID=A0A284QWZ4_ARMOS|nr:uncharacterized protein ARMOST_04300 [Armillaria ostoyae]